MRVFDTNQEKQEFGTLAFDPGGRWLVASGESDSVVWDLTGPHPPVWTSLALDHGFLPDGRVLYAYGDDLIALDPASRWRVAIWTGGRYGTRLTLGPTGAWLVSCRMYEDYSTRLIAIGNPGRPHQRELWSIGLGDADGERGASERLSCLGDDERFLSAENISSGSSFMTKYYRVAIRSRADGRLLADAKRVYGYGDKVLASPASEFFVILSAARFRVHRINDLEARPHEVKNDGRKHFTAAAFHPSGHFMMAASNDATVKLYDTRSWAVARTFTWDIGRMRSVAFSADGNLAAAGSDSGKVVVWDVDI